MSCALPVRSDGNDALPNTCIDASSIYIDACSSKAGRPAYHVLLIPTSPPSLHGDGRSPTIYSGLYGSTQANLLLIKFLLLNLLLAYADTAEAPESSRHLAYGE